MKGCILKGNHEILREGVQHKVCFPFCWSWPAGGDIF